MSHVTMPNYDKQRQASALLCTVLLAVTDHHTAAPGWRREARFDRELGGWVAGEIHTVPKAFGTIQITFHLGQN